MRFMIGFFLFGLIGLALVIYEVKYETRMLDARTDELHKAIEEERNAIAVLRAEWSLLNRPERIERLARKYLGLEPLEAQRMVTLNGMETPQGRPMTHQDDDAQTQSGGGTGLKVVTH